MRLVGLSTVRFEGVSIPFDVGCYRGAGSEGGGYGGVEKGFDIREGSVRVGSARKSYGMLGDGDGTFSHAGTQTGTSPGAADRNGFVCLTSKVNPCTAPPIKCTFKRLGGEKPTMNTTVN
jgi:hypothetical protein